MRDEMDAAKDRDIAEHVLEMHRYVRPGHENIPETEEVENDESDDKGEMFVKLAHDRLPEEVRRLREDEADGGIERAFRSRS